MATQAIINEIVAYYVNLLIIQYHNQPKAQAEIALLITLLLISDITQDVESGYSVEEITAWTPTGQQTIGTAVGAQLDVIGKYAGVDRYYRELDLTDYFGFIGYNEISAGEPDPGVTGRYGFSDYADFTGDDYNGTLTYSGFFSQNNQLFDSVFLQLILYAIQLNTLDFSFKSIDTLLNNFFAGVMRAEYGPPPKVMTYFIDGEPTPLMQAIIYKNLLPTPMAVGAVIVSGVTGDIYAMPSYSDISGNAISPFAGGFSDYADYATLPGNVLSYNDMSAA